jgi:predicted hydrocarbon binding protein
MEDKGIDKACYFLEEFYSNAFSMLSGSEVKVTEVECALHSKEDYCIFRKS